MNVPVTAASKHGATLEIAEAIAAPVRALHVADGDFRDWAAIDAFAGGIAPALTEQAEPAAAGQ